MFSRPLRNKLRKEKCSALFKLSKISTEKQNLQTIYKDILNIQNQNGLKINAEDNFKGIGLRFALRYSKLIFVNSKSEQQAANEVFSTNLGEVDQIVQKTYKNFKKSFKNQFLQQMVKRTHLYLSVFKKAFLGNLDDEKMICQNLESLYDIDVVNHPQHYKSRMEIAKIIKKYADYYKNIKEKDQQSTMDPQANAIFKKQTNVRKAKKLQKRTKQLKIDEKFSLDDLEDIYPNIYEMKPLKMLTFEQIQNLSNNKQSLIDNQIFQW